MKKILFIALGVVSATMAFAQGTIQIVNNGTAHDSTAFRSLVYGPQVATPNVVTTGNSAADFPAGATVYTGGTLSGTGFSAQLWGAASGQTLVALKDTASSDVILPFRTGGGAGIMIANPTGLACVVPGVVENGIADLQLRAWDNAGGTLTTYAAALTKGNSATFSSQPLGGVQTQPPILEGLTSFSLATTAPEPSTIALAVMGASAFLVRRRKK